MKLIKKLDTLNNIIKYYILFDNNKRSFYAYTFNELIKNYNFKAMIEDYPEKIIYEIIYEIEFKDIEELKDKIPHEFL